MLRVRGSRVLLALLACLTGCPPAQDNRLKPRQPTGTKGSIFSNPDDKPPKLPYDEVADVETTDDIVFVNSYWQPQPWIVDSSNVVRGMSARSYFVSRQSERGVFVSGTIIAWINLIEEDALGRQARARVGELRFTPDEAMGMRVRRKSLLGYSYGLILPFPENLPLANKQVEVQVGYETLDGRVIKSAARRFRVPITASPPLDDTPPEPRPAARQAPPADRSARVAGEGS